MAKYIVIAPDKDTIYITVGYGTVPFKHGSYMTDDRIASMYPNNFIKVPEGVDVKPKEVKKQVETSKVEVKKETQKQEGRKRGRPSKSLGKGN